MNLVIARGCTPTGNLLRTLLQERNVLNLPGTVSWGCPLNATGPTLNARASSVSKMQELAILRAAGVRVPRTWPASAWNQNLPRPILARKAKHKGGRDIRLVQTLKGLQVWAAKRDFFSEYIANDREYRVFIYRSAHLGTYEKVLRHPELQHRAVGRNYHNGYAFELVREANIPRAAVEAAKAAIVAMGLDFGAVDIIHGRDGNYYVLEVNTAPGVEDGRRQVIQALADKIANWARKGNPARRADGQ